MTEPIFDLVISDLRAREAQGAETYGKARMEAHDGRDTLKDAYEEALDLAAYLRKAIAEREVERTGPRFAENAPREAVVEQVQAGKHVSIAEHVIESDGDYARRMGWDLEGGRWGRETRDAVGFPFIMETPDDLYYLHVCRDEGPCGATKHPTLRAAVDAYEAQTGKTLAQALAEVGEDEPA